MKWSIIREEIRAATLATFDKLVSSTGNEQLYSFCLQTSDDGINVGSSANTEEGYSEKCASEAQFEELTPEYLSYLRWAPAEWRYEVLGDRHFTSVNRYLLETAADADSDFVTHFKLLIDAMIDGLAHLRNERAEALTNVALFVTVSDSEDVEGIERRSAEILNTSRVADEIVARFS